MPSERLARFLLTLATVVVVVGTVGVFLFPDQILFLMTVEREVRTAKPGELLAVRAVAALALLGMLTMVAFRKPLGRAVARRWGADTDAFLHDIGSDIRTWMGDPAYRWHRAGLLLLIVWATVLRLIPLGWPIGYDEAISAVWFSSRSWIDVVTDYSFPNNHILYNLITNFLVHAFGVTTLTVRLPAMMAGVLVVPVGRSTRCRRRISSLANGSFFKRKTSILNMVGR